MASVKKDVAELEAMTFKLKKQFDSHIFCLDQKANNKLDLLQEYHEYLKRRAELETDYNKKLESCSDRFLERLTRLRNANSTRGVTPTPSSTTSDLLYGVLAEARALATRRTQFTDQLSADVLNRIDVLIRDTTLIARKVKDIGSNMHEDMMKSHRELTEAAKGYLSVYTSMADTHSKLLKLQARSAKGKKADKKKETRLITMVVAGKRDVIKARNQYLLQLKGANVHTQRYFSKGLFELFEYADYDFQWTVGKIFTAQAEAETALSNLHKEATEAGVKLSQRLDTKQDLHRFCQDFGNYFYPPPEFQFIPARKDEPSSLTVIEGIWEEMKREREQLFDKLSTLHFTVEEENKTLDCVEKNLANVQSLVFDNGKPKLPNGLLVPGEAEPVPEPDETAQLPPPPETQRRTSGGQSSGHSRGVSVGNVRSSLMNERKEHMDYLYNVLHRISTSKTSLDKWDAQHTLMDGTLSNLTEAQVAKRTHTEVQTSLGLARPGRVLPKLFGGEIDEYISATNDIIPLVVKSCCKHISHHGATTEGVFRVPGPANEIDELKQKFEQGHDPLVNNTEVDVHAVASLLKQYFRDLKTSVFPDTMYNDLIKIHPSVGDEQRRMIDEAKRNVQRLTRNRQSILQYLFKFLQDFSVFSDHTKMTGSNIALVFGPTLIGNPQMDPQAMAQGMPLVNRTCLFLLDNRLEIFGDPPVPRPESAIAPTEPPVEPGDFVVLPTSAQTPHYYQDYANQGEGDEDDTGLYAIPSGPQVIADAPDVIDNNFTEPDEETYEKIRQTMAGEAEEECDDIESDTESEGSPEVRLVHAIHDYDARNEKELSFKRGEVIEVFTVTADNNWWDAVISDTRGYIPASYVKELSGPPLSSSVSQTESVDLSTSQTLSLDSQGQSVTSGNPLLSSQTGGGLLTLPEDNEMHVTASAPHHADHLAVDVSDEETRRRSTGDSTMTSGSRLRETHDPSQQHQGHSLTPASTFGQPGSSASLDRVSARVGMFAGGQAGGGGPGGAKPPPVRAKPGKLKANFEQLEGVLGGGGGPMGVVPRSKPGSGGATPQEEYPGRSRPPPIQGQRRQARH